ncbi:MAG: ABC transporter ATP-binding protein [Betaproteobacteria bacterium]|nr:ABC transporter ATP-binding protein [Betaproteobacteria bacterium]
MLLEVRALDVTYGTTRAVRGLDLTVEAGEIVTVLGANGAGKSSLLRAVQGLVRPANGAILFNGDSVAGSSAASRVSRGLVLVPEGRQIFTSLTVHDNLLMGAYSRRDDPAKEIDQIYQRFPNLARRRDMFASVLSGGEQQMLAIGRALLSRPKLMMLDEPSLGLSPLLVRALFDLIGELNRDGLSMLLVEQNTQMALQCAHRAYVLELGRLAMSGAAADILGDPRIAAAYLGSSERRHS